MADKRISVTLDIGADISKVKSVTEDLNKIFSTMGLSSSISKSLNNYINGLRNALTDLESKSSNPLQSLTDVKGIEGAQRKVENYINKIKIALQDLSERQGIDLQKAFPEYGEFVKQINQAKNAFSDATADINKNIKNQTEALSKEKKEVTRLSNKLDDLNAKQGSKSAAKSKTQANYDAGIEKMNDLVAAAERAKAKLAETKAELDAFEEANKDKKARSTGNIDKRYKSLYAEENDKKEAVAEAETEYNAATQAVENHRIKLEQLSSAAQTAANNYEKHMASIKQTSEDLEASKIKIDNLKKSLEILQNTSIPAEAFEEFKNKIIGITGDETLSKLTNTKEGLEQIFQVIAKAEGVQLEGIADAIAEAAGSVNLLKQNVEGVDAPIERTRNELQRLGETESDIAHLTSRLKYFFSLAGGFQLMRRAIRSAVDTTKELDAVMTQTAVVSDYSVGDMWKTLPQYSKYAKDLGAQIKDVYSAQTLYVQQGLNMNDAMDLGIETLKMARVAGIDAAEATNSMTAALRGFNMELTENSAIRINDVYSKLAQNTASNVQEISTAMSKVAALANSANMSFENTSAFLATIIESTREGAETAGTALKTVIARFTEVKKLYSEGELTGTDEEGQEVDVNKISAALRTAGINMNDFFTGAKGLDEIFIELGSKWNSLTTVQQRYIATMAAGSRQQSRFLALMQNYSRTVELTQMAYNSAGSGQEQFEKTLDSLEAKLNKLKAAWDTFTMGIANSDFIKGAIDAGTKILDLLNSIIDKLSGGKGITKSILSLVTAVGIFKGGKSLFNMILGKAAPSLIKNSGLKQLGMQSGITLAAQMTTSFKKAFERGGEGKLFSKTAASPFIQWLRGTYGSYDTKDIEKINQVKNQLFQGHDISAVQQQAIMLDIKTGNIDQANAKLKELGLKEKATAEQTQLLSSATQKTGANLSNLATTAGILGGVFIGVGSALENVGGTVGKFGTVIKGIGIGLVSFMGIIKVLDVAIKTFSASATASISSIPILGWIAAAISAIIALISVTSQLNESPSQYAQRLAEELEKSEEVLDKYKDDINKINELLIQIEEDQDVFNNLIQGTKEWDGAVKTLNSHLKELLELAPQLYSAISYDKNGNLIIDESKIENYQQNQEESQLYAEFSNLGAKQRVLKNQSIDPFNKHNYPFWSTQGISVWKNQYWWASEDALNDYINNIVKYSKNSEITKESREKLKQQYLDRGYTEDQFNNFMQEYDISTTEALGQQISDRIINDYNFRQKLNNFDEVKDRKEAREFLKDAGFLEAYLFNDEQISSLIYKAYTEVINTDIQKERQEKTNENTFYLRKKLIDSLDVDSFGKNLLLGYLEKIPYSSATYGDYKDLNETDKEIVRRGLGIEATDTESIKKITLDQVRDVLGTRDYYNNLQEKADNYVKWYNQLSEKNKKYIQGDGTRNQEFTQKYNSIYTKEEWAELEAERKQKFLEADEKIKKYFDIDDEDLPDVSVSLWESISDLINSVGMNYGKTAAKEVYDNLINSLNIEDIDSEKFVSALQQIDFSSIESSKELATELEKLGVYVDKDAEWFTTLASSLIKFNAELKAFNLNSLREEIKNSLELQERVKSSKTASFDQETYEELIKYGANKADFVWSGKEWTYIGGTMEILSASLDKNTDAIIQQTKDNLIKQLETADIFDRIVENNKDFISEEITSTEIREILQENGIEKLYNKRTNEYLSISELTNEALKNLYNDYMDASVRKTELEAQLASIDKNSLFYGKTGDYAREMGATSEMQQALLLNQAIEAGIDLNVLDQYTKQLEETYNNLSREMAMAIAYDNMMMNKGIEELASNYEEWNKVLEADEGTGAYEEALIGLNKALKKITGTTQDFSREFLSSTENAEMFKKAAEGDAEAINQLRKAGAKDILKGFKLDNKVINKLTSIIDNLDLNVEIGTELKSNYTNAFQNLLDAGILTAEQVNQALETIGYEPNVQYEQMPFSSATNYTQTVYTKGSNGNMSKVENVADMAQNEMVYIPIIGGSSTSKSIGSSIKAPTYKGPTSSTVTQPKTGGGGGGGGGGGKEFKNDFDKYYNMVEDINELERLRNLLETDYNQLLEAEGTSGKQIYDNLKKQVDLLKERQKLTADLAERRKGQIFDLLNDEEYKDVKQYAWWNEEDQTIEIDWDAINDIKDSETGDKVKELVQKLEDFQSKYDEQIEALEEIEDALEDIRKRGRDEYISLEERLRDALIAKIQEQIDELSATNEAIDTANSNLMDSIQKALEQQRQERENAKTEEELADKEQRLAYLQQDSSNANAVEIAQLQKELDEARENYTDQLIDQKISELQEQNDEAAQQRQEQIDLMQQSLDWQEKNGEFWEQAYQILEQSIGPDGSLLKGSELEQLLKTSEGWQGLSDAAKMKWLEELETQVAQAVGYLSLSRQLEDIGTKAGTEITFTNAEGKTLTGKVDKDGNVVVTNADGSTTTYKDVYQSYDGTYHTMESEKDAKTEKKPATDSPQPQEPGTSTPGGLTYTSDYEYASDQTCMEIRHYSDGSIKRIAGGHVIVNEVCKKCHHSFKKPSNSSGGCFAAGTKIIMSDFTTKNIEDVLIGDEVVAYNEEKELFEFKKVTKSYKHYNTPRVIKVILSNNVVLKITPGHPILTTEGWKSRDIENSFYEHNTIATWLNIGDRVIGYSGIVVVENIVEMEIPNNYITYNIEVEVCHTYLADGIVVHNMKVRYATGGLNTETGLAWLDGTKSHPELVLNARDTENFIQLKDHLATLRQMSTNGLLGAGGDNYYDIDVHVDSLGSDYDVDMAIDRIKARIYQDGAYRNVNTLNRLR